MFTEIHQFFEENLKDYSNLNQNDLISETKVISFAKDRGISIAGVVKGDPSRFIELGWLTVDSNNLFHPFRIYPFWRAVQLCKLRHTVTSSINRDSFQDFLRHVSDSLPSLELIEAEVQLANQISNLAILLEPIYWPKITNKTKLRFPYYSTLDEFDETLFPYKNKILAYVKTLDIETWRSNHEKLRIEAARLDDNYELYMMLRLAPWTKREKITGNIGGALWLRHIAEVIRLAFEEVHGVKWLEEQEAFGFWDEGAKTRLYGSERPITNGLITRPHLAFEFGLHTGSTVRWYVEGETEYQAALHALPNASLGGIEVINLKGVLHEKPNAPMRFEDHLKNDKEFRRFSYISFDEDRADNVKILRQHINQANVVGYINLNKPDFEFENFTLDELIEIAFKLDQNLGFDSQHLMSGNKQTISSGKAFEKYYIEHSERKVSLKGYEWGQALAKYACENPLKKDSGKKRAFIETVEKVLLAKRVSYDYHRDHYEIDPNDFQIKEKSNLDLKLK